MRSISRYGLWNCAIVAQDINLTTRKTLHDKTVFNFLSVFVFLETQRPITYLTFFFSQLCDLVKLLV